MSVVSFTRFLKKYSAVCGLLILSLFAYPGLAAAHQNALPFLSARDGLPSNQVKGVIESEDGFLWFATSNGVAKYNGNDFVYFQYDATNPYSLSSNNTTSILEVPNEGVWVGSANGVSLIDSNSDIVYPLNLPLPHPYVYDLYLDSSDRVWIATEQGVAVWDKGETRTLQMSNLNSADKPVRRVIETCNNSMWIMGHRELIVWNETGLRLIDQFEGEQGRFMDIEFVNETIWVGTRGSGVIGYNCQGEKTHQFTASSHPLMIKSDDVWALESDQDGSLWVGYFYQGATRIAKDLKAYIQLGNADKDSISLNSEEVLEIFQVDSGLVWLSTSVGVVKFAPGMEGLTFYYGDNGFDLVNVWNIKETDQEYLFIHDFGIHQKNKETGEMTPLANIEGVYNVVEIEKEKEWLAASEFGLFRVKRGQAEKVESERFPSIANTRILAIENIGDTSYLLGGSNGFLYIWHKRDGIVKQIRWTQKNWWVVSFAKGISGVWMATENGLYFIDGQSEEIVPIELPKLNSTYITDLALQNTTLWVSTLNKGIVKLNLAENGRDVVNADYLSKNEGLPSNAVAALVLNDHQLWFAAKHLVGFYDLNSKEVFTFYGLLNHQNRQFLESSGYLASNGHVFFGAHAGAVSIDVNVVIPKSQDPKLQFSKVLLDGEPLRYAPKSKQTIDVPADTKTVQIQFSALEYGAPETIQYRHRLVPISNWSEPSKDNSMTIANLSKGVYRLEVQSTNGDGGWVESTAMIQLNVQPAWYQKTWFYLIILAFVVTLLLALIKWRRQVYSSLIHETKHDELTGLPNRRFLFDALKKRLNNVRNGQNSLGVMFVDVDKFKQVNDKYGHDVGDGLLKKLASTIQDELAEGDFFARLSGDEFIILHGPYESDTDLHNLIMAILVAFESPIPIAGVNLEVSLSLGVAVAHSPDVEPDALIRHADRAMYQAKFQGGKNYQIFNEEIR